MEGSHVPDGSSNARQITGLLRELRQGNQAVADELGRFLSGEPIVARPLSRVSGAVRWCRRKPLAAAVVALFFVLFAVLAAGMPLLTMGYRFATNCPRRR